MSPDIDTRLLDLEARMTTLEAKQGVVRLTPALWALILTTLGIVWGAAVLVVAMQVTVNAHSIALATLQGKLDAHATSDGHPVSLERWRVVTEQVKDLHDKRGNP